MKYVVDLDDTLVSSTMLNNDAYNFALEKFAFPRINTYGRITREMFLDIKYSLRKKIINEKQEYFQLDWLKYRIIKNYALIEKLRTKSSSNCYLWTKANKERTFAILEACDLSKYFCRIIFDKKESYTKSKQKLVKILKTNSFVIYENNHIFFKNQNAKIIDVIQNKTFDVIGYEIT